MPTVSGPNELSLDVLADPEVRLSLTPRSGPIEIEIEYRVDPAKARLFYAVMQHVQLSRQRNGAYGWSIARDIADLNYGPSGTIAQRGKTICGSEADHRIRVRTAPSRQRIPHRSGTHPDSPHAWNALLDLCAGKMTHPIDQPAM